MTCKNVLVIKGKTRETMMDWPSNISPARSYLCGRKEEVRTKLCVNI